MRRVRFFTFDNWPSNYKKKIRVALNDAFIAGQTLPEVMEFVQVEYLKITMFKMRKSFFTDMAKRIGTSARNFYVLRRKHKLKRFNHD